jgi:hypothetical protein
MKKALCNGNMLTAEGGGDDAWKMNLIGYTTFTHSADGRVHLLFYGMRSNPLAILTSCQSNWRNLTSG